MIDLCHKTSTVKSNLPWSGSDHGWAQSARSSPTTSALQNLQSGTPPSCSKFVLTSNQPAASTDCTWILVLTRLVLVPAARARDNARLKQTAEEADTSPNSDAQARRDKLEYPRRRAGFSLGRERAGIRPDRQAHFIPVCGGLFKFRRPVFSSQPDAGGQMIEFWLSFCPRPGFQKR